MLFACLASALDTRIPSIRPWRISFGIYISRRFRVLFVPKLLRYIRVDSMEGGGKRAPGGRICRTGKKRGKYGTRLFSAKCFQSNVHFLNKLCQEGLSGAWAQCKHRLPSYSFFLLPFHPLWGRGHKQNKRGSFSLFLPTTLSLRGRLKTIMKREGGGEGQ